MEGQKKRLLSGVKPTGKPHLGNYFGAMKQFVDLQNQYDCFYMVADYHALNFIQNGDEMRSLTHELILDFLGIGLDPEKVTLFKQSAVQAHTELAWIFDTITTMPYLMRAHAFKDAEAKNKEISVGAFNYPMLMAADILLYDPEVVPVGQDQKQHIEYARDTAQKFNNIFGETFTLPKEIIPALVATVPGTDGQKMSKSYGNTIPLFGTKDEIAKAVMSIVTDSGGTGAPNVYSIHLLVRGTLTNDFKNGQGIKELNELYKENENNYKVLKEKLIEDLEAMIAPMRERRAEFAANPEKVKEIIEKGNTRAKEVASSKMADVRQKIGVTI